MSYRIDGGGKLVYLNGTPVWGQRPCCLALDESRNTLYSANFYGGSISMVPLCDDGVGPVRKIITAPKPEHWLHAMHWVEVLEGGDHLAAINVAQSELSIYDAATGERVTGHCFGDRIFARAVVSYGPFIYAMLQDPGIIYPLCPRRASRKSCRFCDDLSLAIPGRCPCGVGACSYAGHRVQSAELVNKRWSSYAICEAVSLQSGKVLCLVYTGGTRKTTSSRCR